MGIRVEGLEFGDDSFCLRSESPQPEASAGLGCKKNQRPSQLPRFLLDAADMAGGLVKIQWPLLASPLYYGILK